MNNFLHNRNNAIFQMPFCIFYPLAGISWASCLCSRALSQSDSIFTRVNEGSYLVLTTKGIVKYTPSISITPLCCSCASCAQTWEEKIIELPWASFEGVPTDFRTHLKDPGCGVHNPAICDLHECFGMCFVVPCAELWHKCFKTGICGFEDSNTSILFKSTELKILNYGPDLRAPQIRQAILNEASINLLRQNGIV